MFCMYVLYVFYVEKRSKSHLHTQTERLVSFCAASYVIHSVRHLLWHQWQHKSNMVHYKTILMPGRKGQLEGLLFQDLSWNVSCPVYLLSNIRYPNLIRLYLVVLQSPQQMLYWPCFATTTDPKIISYLIHQILWMSGQTLCMSERGMAFKTATSWRIIGHAHRSKVNYNRKNPFDVPQSRTVLLW